MMKMKKEAIYDSKNIRAKMSISYRAAVKSEERG